jgi:hypothetical protein
MALSPPEADDLVKPFLRSARLQPFDGVRMLYQGDKVPAVYGGQGESNVDFLAGIYGLRKQLEFVAQMRGLEHIQPTDATNGFDR